MHAFKRRQRVFGDVDTVNPRGNGNLDFRPKLDVDFDVLDL